MRSEGDRLSVRVCSKDIVRILKVCKDFIGFNYKDLYLFKFKSGRY